MPAAPFVAKPPLADPAFAQTDGRIALAARHPDHEVMPRGSAGHDLRTEWRVRSIQSGQSAVGVYAGSRAAASHAPILLADLQTSTSAA